MYSIENKSEESRAIQNNSEKHVPTVQFKDNRSLSAVEVGQNTAQLEKKENLTGMPDDLKEGIESLSGFSMDDVRVHYNSSKPATVQALAYTQGTDIHVAPGQEKHLPHEAWHVAQQMAGRVSPTTNINGMPVNDNVELEREADEMGEKAVQCKDEQNHIFQCKRVPSLPKVFQMFEAKLHFTRKSDETNVFNTSNIRTFGMLKRLVSIEDGEFNVPDHTYNYTDFWLGENPLISMNMGVVRAIVNKYEKYISDDTSLEYSWRDKDSLDKGLEGKLIRVGESNPLEYLGNSNLGNIYFMILGAFDSPTFAKDQIKDCVATVDETIENSSYTDKTSEGHWRMDEQNPVTIDPYSFSNYQMQLNGLFKEKSTYATVIVQAGLNLYPAHEWFKKCVKLSFDELKTVIIGTKEAIQAFTSAH